MRFRLSVKAKKISLHVAAHTLSLVLLVGAFAWFLGRTIPNRIEKNNALPVVVKNVPRSYPIAMPPETKPARKRPAKKKYSKNANYSPQSKIPAIHIYYRPQELSAYMKALRQRGCLILVKSPLTGLFALYDPFNNIIKNKIPKNLAHYSPRTRILAVYGENGLTDKIIREAVDQSNQVFLPDNCRLVALLSKGWEKAILNTINAVAQNQGIGLKAVETAEAVFQDNQFYLRAVKSRASGSPGRQITLKNLNHPIN